MLYDNIILNNKQCVVTYIDFAAAFDTYLRAPLWVASPAVPSAQRSAPTLAHRSMMRQAPLEPLRSYYLNLSKEYAPKI